MKTIITILLIFFSLLVSSQTTFGVNGIGYQITSSNTVKVCCSANFVGSATIPDQVEFNTDIYTVTSIVGPFGPGLTGIIIPTTVKNIGDGAFNGCANLVDVYIPSTVTSIGVGLFENCTSLKTARIPTRILPDRTFFGCSSLISVSSPIDVQVTEIGKDAFYGCISLTSFPIQNSAITKIGSTAFSGCKGLTSLSLPGTLTEIGQQAFRDCTSLTSVDMSNSVSTMGDGVFSGCTSLKLVTWPGNVSNIPADTFYGCKGLEAFAIPNTVKKIGANAFYNCTGIKSLTIPSSVNNIGDNAFFNCTSLTSLTSLNLNTANIILGSNVFYGVPTHKNQLIELCKLFVPDESISLYSLANQWQSFTNILPISTLTVENLEQSNMQLYPNPAKTFFSIRGEVDNQIWGYSITDISGRIIKYGKYRYDEKIDVESLKNGHYIIQLTSKTGKKKHLKLIKN